MPDRLARYHSLYRLIFKHWRQKRFALFIRTIQPRPSESLLDVGGTAEFWEKRSDLVANIDVVNVETAPREQSRGNIRILIGDGCALPMADNSYDIGFSNSVIEHVGSWHRQQQFAAEIRRVGRKLWVQTPARGCPLEPHYLGLFVHYLPRGMQRRVIRWVTGWGLIRRPTQKEIDEMVETTRLLTKTEMHELFPDCAIMTERLFFFFPKSYIAWRRA